MTSDPKLYRDPVRGIGSPEDPKATDPDADNSIVSLLKGILDGLPPAGIFVGSATLTFIIDGGGSEITTGIKGDLRVPFACTIDRATMLADQSGSIVVDIWKDTYTNFPPTNAGSITASAPPTISSAVKSQDDTLTGWATSISAGDVLRFNVDSVTTLERVTISLRVAL